MHLCGWHESAFGPGGCCLFLNWKMQKREHFPDYGLASRAPCTFQDWFQDFIDFHYIGQLIALNFYHHNSQQGHLVFSNQLLLVVPKARLTLSYQVYKLCLETHFIPWVFELLSIYLYRRCYRYIYISIIFPDITFRQLLSFLNILIYVWIELRNLYVAVFKTETNAKMTIV